MSFDKITAGYIPRQEDVVIKINKESVKFVAKEISYFKAQGLALKAQREGDASLKELVVASIYDQEGKQMSLEQAEALPREYADLFLAAALRVNKLDSTEEGAKKN